MKKIFSLAFLVLCSLFCTMSAKVIYYTGSHATPYVYYWGGTSSTTWPGDAMTLVDGTTNVWQSSDLDCSSCIFSNNGANQTADLSIPADKNYYNNGVWDVYGEAPTVSYYLTGNAALCEAAAQGTAWDAMAIEMAEGTYTFTSMPAGEYKMKVTMGTWTGAMGYAELAPESSEGISTDTDGNICFEVVTPNDVTVAVADGKVTVTGVFKIHLPEVDIKGINDGWEGVRMVNNSDSMGCTYTYTLTAGTYEFKMFIEGTWLGNNGTMNRLNSKGWTMEEELGNCSLDADIDGDYVFTYIYETHKLSVAYPSVTALNPYAYGISAVENENNHILTVSYSLNVDAEDVLVQLVDSSDEVLAEEEGEIVKGTHTVNLSLATVYPGDYTIKVATTGMNHDFTTYSDSTKTFANRYHATVDANPLSPNFGMIYGASRGSDIGTYIINPDYSYNNTTPNMLGQASWASVQRGAVAPNGEMWFSSWGDATSGIYRYDHSADPDHVTQFFQGTRNGKGMFINNGVEVGCSTPGIAIYDGGAESKLYVMSEDFTNGSTSGSMAVYNIGQPDGSIVTSWGEAPSSHFNISDNAGTNFALCATPYGVWACQHRALGSNSSGARSLLFYTPEGVRKFVSTDTELINGSCGAGIVMNATYDKLWMVDGRGDIMQFAVAWAADSVPTLTKEATYATPFGAIAQMTFDYAGNIVAVGGTGNTPYSNNAAVLRLAVFSLPTLAPVAVTPKAVTTVGIPTPTSFEETSVTKVVKFYQNGQLLIKKGNAVYNVQGMRVK